MENAYARELTPWGTLGLCVAVEQAGGNNVLQSYDILAVCPSNLRTFNYVCANADVDIILVDYSRKIPFHMPKKAVDVALKRGVCLEILYAPTIKGKLASPCRLRCVTTA